MKHSPKIATCCYCGTRAALVLAGGTRHELACSSCGAPLHDLKTLRSGHHGIPNVVHKGRKQPGALPSRPKRKKPKKSLGRRFLGEAFDLLDDIFD